MYSRRSLVATLHDDGSVRLWDPEDEDGTLLQHCLAPPSTETADDNLSLAELYDLNPLRTVVCVEDKLVRLPDLTVWHLVDPLPARCAADDTDGWLLAARSPPAPPPIRVSSRCALSSQGLAPESKQPQKNANAPRSIPRSSISAGVAVGHYLFLGGYEGSIEGVDPSDARVVFGGALLKQRREEPMAGKGVSTMIEYKDGVLCGTYGGQLRRIVPKRHRTSNRALKERWIEVVANSNSNSKSVRLLGVHCTGSIVSATHGAAVSVWKDLKAEQHVRNTFDLHGAPGSGFYANSMLVTANYVFVGTLGVVYVFCVAARGKLTLHCSLDCGMNLDDEIVALWMTPQGLLRCLSCSGHQWLWKV